MNDPATEEVNFYPQCVHCGEHIPLMRVNQHSATCRGPVLDDQPPQLNSFLTRQTPTALRSNNLLDPIGRIGFFIDDRGEIRNIASKRHINDEIRFSEHGDNLQKEVLDALVSFIQSKR